MNTHLIYLASPYSHPNEIVREWRAREAARVAAALKMKGHHIFAPIPHGHMMTPYGLPGGYEEFWKPYCRNVIKRMDIVWVLTLDGWKESVGVQDEIQFAQSLDIPVLTVDPDTLVIATYY